MPEATPDATSANEKEAPAVDPSAEASASGAAQDEAEAVQAPEASEAEELVRPAAVARKRVLLVEPNGKLRGAVVALARTLHHVNVSPFSSVDLGEEYMKTHRIQALLLAVGEGAEPMDFLARLRRGECPCDADIPVVVTAQACDAQLAGQLKEYGVSRLLIEPYKLGDMAHTLEQLWEIKVDIPPQSAAPGAAPVAEPADASAPDPAPETAEVAQAEAA